jgi:GNAT superfamily N-acetyltransferase
MTPESADLAIRRAEAADVPAIVALHAADAAGGHGDTTDAAALPDYLEAFARIAASPCDALYVAVRDGVVVGTFQTTLTPMLTGRGRLAMTIESVQTRADQRGRGIGAEMMRHAIERAREAGCALVQLSSNAARGDAHRFYERLGFAKSHVAFKMKL